MKMNCESIKVSNVQWPKVGMESVVKKCVIDCEVNRGRPHDVCWYWSVL